MRVIREILDGDGADVPLTFLNVTQLSMYRKDAHTSIYKRQWSQPTAEQLADPRTYADCVHASRAFRTRGTSSSTPSSSTLDRRHEVTIVVSACCN